jgi:hypothetical protein
MSGGKWVKAKGMKDRNPLTQRPHVRLQDVLAKIWKNLIPPPFPCTEYGGRNLLHNTKNIALTSQKTTILSHLCVNLKCHNLQFFIILCTIISILLKSTKVLYHPATCRMSGKSLSSCPKQAHTQDEGEGRGCWAATLTQIEILKP